MEGREERTLLNMTTSIPRWWSQLIKYRLPMKADIAFFQVVQKDRIFLAPRVFTIFGYKEFDSLPTPKGGVPLSEEQGRELERMKLRAGSIS